MVNSNVELLPVAALNGVEDTQNVFGLDVVSFGYDASRHWGPTMLCDETVIKFTWHPKLN